MSYGKKTGNEHEAKRPELKSSVDHKETFCVTLRVFLPSGGHVLQSSHLYTCILTQHVKSQNYDQFVFVELMSLQLQHPRSLGRFREALSCKGV